jgi:hypothetical protein
LLLFSVFHNLCVLNIYLFRFHFLIESPAILNDLRSYIEQFGAS